MGAFDPLAAARFNAAPCAQPWLEALREAGRSAWLAAGLPNRRAEAWKYTGVEALGDHDYLQGVAPTPADVSAARALLPALDADVLVFVNGHYCDALSRVTPQAGVTAVRFAAADAVQAELIAAHAGRIAGDGANPFGNLAASWMQDGVLLHLRAGTRMARPLCVVHADTAGERPCAYAQRVLVIAESRAEGELVEYHVGAPGAQHVFATGLTEIALAAGARLRHTRLHREEEHAIHIGGLHVELQAAARYENFLFATGSRLKRVDLRLRHLGDASECLLNGVYLAKHRQHVDFHTAVEHIAQRATTQQVYRGIVDGAARAVFNGRIHIHPQAQKSSADLSNRNLLLSDTAEIDTKPELEIYADDVRCSHGATVSQIADLALYYLRTRGIDLQEARLLLGFGFINELVDALPDEVLAAGLREEVRHWFDAGAKELSA